MSDGDADWALFKNPVDTIGAALAGGQDRRFLQQQRDFQNQQNQAALAASQRTQAAIPAITTALGNGDYSGAEIAAAVSGNKDLGTTIASLADRHRQQLADYAGTIGSIAQGLKAIPLGANGDDAARASAFASQVPALRAHGAPDPDIRAALAGGFNDDAINGYINSASTVQQHIDNANKTTELGLRQQEIDKPVSVGEGNSLVNPTTGQAIYTAPFKPDAKVVRAADGSESLVPIDYNGGGGAGSVTPSPASAGNTRPQRNNNPGNVKALPGGQMWRGQTGTDDQGYAQFGDQASGERAADRNLQSYARRGITSVSGIVSRWAPRGDRNNTDAYIASVSRALGVDPNQPLDLSNPTVRQALLQKGIFPNEGPRGSTANQGAPVRNAGGGGVTFGTPYTPPSTTANGDGGAGGMTAQAIDLAAREGLKHGGIVPAGYSRNKAAQAAITNRMAQINAGGDVGALVNQGQDLKSAQVMLNGMASDRPGTSGGLTRSANVALDHIAMYRQAALALKNGNVQLFNTISNAVKAQTGNPLPTNAKALAGIVSGEVTKAVNAGAVSDREDVHAQLSNASSPDQIIGAADAYKGLIGAQIQGLAQHYQAVTGRNDFGKYLSPHAQHYLQMGQAGQPVRVTSPAQAAALPSGTRFMTPDGRVITKH